MGVVIKCLFLVPLVYLLVRLSGDLVTGNYINNRRNRPPPPVIAPRDRSLRPHVVGDPNGPETPFPIRVRSRVISGFGRGSSELGIPTANVPTGAIVEGSSNITFEDALHSTGVYYGFAQIIPNATVERKDAVAVPEHAHDDEIILDGGVNLDPKTEVGNVMPMVMSVGWNPYFKNSRKSAEIHIMHKFKAPFYGADINLIILGYIRPEYDYVSMEALIQDIRTDIKVAETSLERPTYQEYSKDPLFTIKS